MMEIYYLNAKGEKLNLTEWPYRIQTGDILNYKKPYIFSQTSYGGEILGFNPELVEKNITLTVSAKSMAEYYAALNHFYDVVDYDVVNLIPGKLYVNGQYMRCFIFGSEKTEWEYGCNWLDNAIAIVSGTAVWITESTKSFTTAGSQSGAGLDYPHDYGFDYAPKVLSDTIVNDNYAAVDFRMTIYGPAVNPSVAIGSNVYKIYTELTAGEYLVIDTQEKIVEQYDNMGGMTIKYNNREKDYEIYAPIPPGASPVIWAGDFGFDLTTYVKRSEPKWIL
ncbi:hypothetical protein [Frisingicoccus sp.]|uniref:hypothetical protein n=1 Tax=Frisingicoccus sp. TaxID=1918627 RepID=UPI002E78DA9D|nr:hypothetical protein [Frisingicoccus sp.]MEE0753144.1 hypothetical protein [Frisingicoccus sp.]